MRLVWTVLLAACGGSAPVPAPAAPSTKVAAPETHADPHAAAVARERADKSLHEDVALDYERPFKTKPLDRSATAKLFGEACEYGDKHGCIVEAQLVALDDRGASFHAVLGHCLAGDTLSCRALPPDAGTPRFPQAPGAMSRRVECQKPPLAAPCNVDGLRRECEAGFPAACGELGATALPDSEDLTERWLQLSVRGCRGGIASECANGSPYSASENERFELAQRLCDLRPGDCAVLALAYQHRKNASGERDSFERDCEYSDHGWGVCIQLASAYVNNELEEPVPGRGQALLDWACPKLLEHSGAQVVEHYPACKLAKQP